MLVTKGFENSAKIIDTHCHLDSSSYDEDLNKILACSFKNNIDKIIIPAADPKDLSKARNIAKTYENVYFATGVHPYECEEFDLAYLKEFIEDEKCVAVGECGLDYFRLEKENKESIKARQKEVFNAQIKLAIDFKKPLIIHSREANEDTFTSLKAHLNELVGGVLHCFNASELLLKLADKFYFGIGGVLTFKNAKNLAQILPKIPKDRLLLETDAPYLSPEPFRGKRNEPLLTNLVAEKMAEILNLSVDEICELCTQNAKNLFFKKDQK